jgi:hypothetical protein
MGRILGRYVVTTRHSTVSSEQSGLHRVFLTHLGRYRYELPDTQNAHAQLYVHATLFLRVRTMSAAGRLLADALKSLHKLTLLCSCHFTRNSFSMFIRLRCMGDKISWLGGWASQWRPPHIRHGAEQVISQSPYNGGSLDCV